MPKHKDFNRPKKRLKKRGKLIMKPEYKRKPKSKKKKKSREMKSP